MRTLSFVFALGITLGLALSVTPVQAARPGNAVSLEQLQLGERVRSIQGDGGALLLFVNDGGLAARVTLEGGGLYLFENTGFFPCLLCTPQPTAATWDGGCSTSVGDLNYGQALDAGESRFILLRDATTTMTARPVGNANCNVIPWQMR